MYPVWSLDGWDFSQYLVKIVRWRDKCLFQGPYLGPQSPGLLTNACTSTKSLGELLPGHQMGPLVERAGTGPGLKGVGTSGSRGTGGHVSYHLCWFWTVPGFQNLLPGSQISHKRTFIYEWVPNYCCSMEVWEGVSYLTILPLPLPYVVLQSW